MKMKAKEAGKLLRERLRKARIDGCRILSKGSDCDCNLCLVDNLLSYISELESEKEIIDESRS